MRGDMCYVYMFMWLCMEVVRLQSWLLLAKPEQHVAAEGDAVESLTTRRQQ